MDRKSSNVKLSQNNWGYLLGLDLTELAAEDLADRFSVGDLLRLRLTGDLLRLRGCAGLLVRLTARFLESLNKLSSFLLFLFGLRLSFLNFDISLLRARILLFNSDTLSSWSLAMLCILFLINFSSLNSLAFKKRYSNKKFWVFYN